MKLRKLTNQKIATLGILAILIPFIITVLLTTTGVFLGYNEVASFSEYIPLPNDYQNMTEEGRREYFFDLHNVKDPLEIEFGTRLRLGFPPWEGILTFPDGYVITQENWLKYLHGEEITVDYVEMTLNVLSMNPPLLTYLGIVGFYIRVILLMSVAIGLVDLLWFG